MTTVVGTTRALTDRPSRRPEVIVVACVLILTASVHAACGRNAVQAAGTVTLVNRVKASVRGDNCPTCAATLEAALSRRLDAVTINVNLERQSLDLAYQSSSPFSSASFRQAVAEGGGEVRRITIEACGTIDTAEGRSWITSGSARLLLEGSGPFVTGTELCVTGELQDLMRPHRLVLGHW